MRMNYLCRTLLVLITVLLMTAWARAASSSVAYTVEWINKTRVHVVWVNLNDKSLKVTPAVAKAGIGQRQSFISFLGQHQPLAQITGSYFCMDTAMPIGDVVIDGNIVYRGPVGTALAITPDNKPQMKNIPYGWKYSWPGYESVLKGGIRLVQDGKYAVYPRQQGYRDPGLFRPATRTAIGIDARDRLLMVAINKPILLSDLAGIMKALGCLQAMTLDGGTSTGLAYKDNVIMTPGRTLSTVLMVVQRPQPPADAASPAEPAIHSHVVDTQSMHTPTPSVAPAPPAQTSAATLRPFLRAALRSLLFISR